ncbi:hypothetical protein Pta6605_20440 [Pseudomonas amygdali pv. tabaci]|nr:hypothetical protein Pta6605_20440 [Pseudomonas amygdali pv. tabaci]
MAVIAFQAAGDDGLGHRLTAGAAQLPGFTEYNRRETVTDWNGQAAVVTAHWSGGG